MFVHPCQQRAVVYGLEPTYKDCCLAARGFSLSRLGRTSHGISSAQEPGSVESETSHNFCAVGNDCGRM